MLACLLKWVSLKLQPKASVRCTPKILHYRSVGGVGKLFWAERMGEHRSMVYHYRNETDRTNGRAGQKQIHMPFNWFCFHSLSRRRTDCCLPWTMDPYFGHRWVTRHWEVCFILSTTLSMYVWRSKTHAFTHTRTRAHTHTRGRVQTTPSSGTLALIWGAICPNGIAYRDRHEHDENHSFLGTPHKRTHTLISVHTHAIYNIRAWPYHTHLITLDPSF